MDPVHELLLELDLAVERLEDVAFDMPCEYDDIVHHLSDVVSAGARAIRDHHSELLANLGASAAAHAAETARASAALERAATRLATAGLRKGLDDVTGCYVYCLWGHDLTTPLYVGKSTNVLARLGHHLSTPSKRAHVVRVSLIRCDDVETMDATERALIRRHQPVLNILGVDRVAS